MPQRSQLVKLKRPCEVCGDIFRPTGARSRLCPKCWLAATQWRRNRK